MKPHYQAITTVYDKDSKHTAVCGETCVIEHVSVSGGNVFVVLINSQGNKLTIPYEAFKDFFRLKELNT